VPYDFFESTEVPEVRKNTKRQEDARPRRLAKPAAKWTSHDVTEEFAYLTRENLPNRWVGQIGGPALNKRLGRWVKEGHFSPEELVAGLDLFFSDPRNLAAGPKAPPLWQRFLGFIPTARGQARVVAGLERAPSALEDGESEATAQKALRRLSE